MADEARSTSHYLKVVSLARPSRLNDLGMVVRKHTEEALQTGRLERVDSLPFGSFRELFGTSTYTVLEFSPYSVDCGFSPQDTSYGTGEEALGAAVSYLEDRGYRALSFDLEGMVDAVH